MYTQPNKLLQSFSRVIKPYACSIIATEGPNILSKLDLAGVEIPFETQFTTRIVLNPETTDQVLHGYFDDSVTFLLLKVTYNETDPACLVEESQYIEYYYGDDPSKKIRYINKLMMLSGNSLYKVPRIFFNNPTSGKVVIDAMIGNMLPSELTPSDVNNTTTINTLSHNSLTSNMVYFSGSTGSTQLQVLNYDNNVVLYLDYNSIDTITIDKNIFEITIVTNSLSTIHLLFLSQFEMYQGLSRLEWALESSVNRLLTVSTPDIDIVSPIVSRTTDTPIVENLYIMPIITSEETFIITKSDIIHKFILDITDDRDGVIDVNDATVTINVYNQIVKLDTITESGIYNVLISISDIANNQTNINFLISVDNVPPVINFSVPTTTFMLSLSGYSGSITTDDIKLSSVTSVTDNLYDWVSQIYTPIQLSGVTFATCMVSIVETSNSPITSTGNYTVTYLATDLSGNLTILYTKTLIVNV